MIDILKQKLPFIYLGTILFILFFAFFGQKGLLKIYKLKKDVHYLETKQKQLEKNNIELSKNISLMKRESAFQEHMSRETLGLAREGDIIYEFLD